MVKEFFAWVKNHFTRKFTVPFHIAGGLIVAFLYPLYPGLAAMCFVSFGIFEFWQAVKEEDTGWLDFWDAVFGLFLGAVILLLR